MGRGEVFVFSVNEEYLAGVATVDPDEVTYDEEERLEQEQREQERREMIGLIQDEYLDLLPPVEADILELLYSDNGITQKQIGEIFGFTQSAVNYRIGRAHDRIRYLHERPKLTATEISARIAEWGEEYGCHEIARCAVMTGMIWDTTCESETASRLGVSQGTVLGHLRILHRELKKVEPQDEVTIWLGRMLSKSGYWRMGILHDSPVAERWASKRAPDPYEPTPAQLERAHAILERQQNRKAKQASISSGRVSICTTEDQMEDAR